MKNHLKKLVCLLVIISAVFALSVSAFAFDTATEVKFDQAYYDSITDADKDDFFKFTLASYGRVYFAVTTDMRPYTLTVYDANKNQVWTKTESRSLSASDTSMSVVYNEAFDAGTYYLKVTGEGTGIFASQSTGSYNFKLSFKAETKVTPETDSDVNNSLASSKTVLLETTSAGKILKEDEEDFYQFVIPSSGTLEFEMLSKMQWYCAYLLDAKGNQIWATEKNEWDSAKKQRKDTHNLELSAGTYYLKVNGFRSSSKIIKSTGNYQFELVFTPAKETAVEPNNSIVEAKKISLDTAITGHLSLTDGRDFFEVTVAKGEVAIGFISYMSSYNVYILDQSGAEKWSSKGNSKDSDAASRKDLHELTLDAGKYYIYVDGGTGKYSFELSQDTAVAKVKTVKYSRTVTTIKLSWSKVAGADGYEVYKYDEDKKEFVKVGSTTKRTRKIKNLKGGTDYDFKVRAYKKLNGSYIYGDFSEERSTTTTPAKAVISKVKAGTKSATVTWKSVNGADGYRVFYSRDRDFDNAKKVIVKDSKATQKTISKLKSGKKYYFKVRAYKTFNGKNVYGALSKIKSVKVK